MNLTRHCESAPQRNCLKFIICSCTLSVLMLLLNQLYNWISISSAAFKLMYHYRLFLMGQNDNTKAPLYAGIAQNAKHSALYLCGFSRARLPHQHKGLVTHQDFCEALPVLPDRQLQTLLQDFIVARRVGQVGEGVDLLLKGGWFHEDSAACSRVGGNPGRLRISVPVPVPVPSSVAVPVPRPFIAVSVPVAPVRQRCPKLRFCSSQCMYTSLHTF